MGFIDSITLVKILPCLAQPGKVIIIGQPDRSLAEVIPYLATLPGVIAYNPETLTLTFRRPHGFMSLYPEKVYITQVADNQAGLDLLAALVEAINATWEGRAELAAVTASRRAPGWLDIWTLLPQTNCKLCGEATCMAFAAALIQHLQEITECLPLTTDPAFAQRRATLEAML